MKRIIPALFLLFALALLIFKPGISHATLACANSSFIASVNSTSAQFGGFPCVQIGDFLLFYVENNVAQTITPQSGVTLQTAYSPQAFQSDLFYRFATSADTSSSTYTFTVGSANFFNGVAYDFRCIDTSAPFDQVVTSNGNGTTVASISSATPNANDEDWIAIFNGNPSISTTVFPAFNFLRANTPSFATANAIWGFSGVAGSGATGSYSITGNSGHYQDFNILLKDAAGTPCPKIRSVATVYTSNSGAATFNTTNSGIQTNDVLYGQVWQANGSPTITLPSGFVAALSQVSAGSDLKIVNAAKLETSPTTSYAFASSDTTDTLWGALLDLVNVTASGIQTNTGTCTSAASCIGGSLPVTAVPAIALYTFAQNAASQPSENPSQTNNVDYGCLIYGGGNCGGELFMGLQSAAGTIPANTASFAANATWAWGLAALANITAAASGDAIPIWRARGGY